MTDDEKFLLFSIAAVLALALVLLILLGGWGVVP